MGDIWQVDLDRPRKGCRVVSIISQVLFLVGALIGIQLVLPEVY